MNGPVLAVIGAGPGLGLAVARRFAREGYHPTLLGRTPSEAQPWADALMAEGFPAEAEGVDLTDPTSMRAAIDDIGNRHGRINVLHFNPSVWREKGPLELTPEELLEDVMQGAAGLLSVVQAARGYFRPGARVLVTGSAAAETPWHGAASLGVQKAAVRNLTTSLDAALCPDGVRAVAVQINGVLGSDGPFSPPPIAEAMWQAIQRPESSWTPQVDYDG